MRSTRSPSLWAAVTVALTASLCLAMACTARAADSIYWVNSGNETISHASLAGGGGGEVPISGAPVSAPSGIAIDAPGGRLLWSNSLQNTIGIAGLDGSQGRLLDTAGAAPAGPTDLAVDAASGRVYWANTDTISFASLSGGGGLLNTAGTLIRGPGALALSPATGRIYWTSEGIFFASLNDSGGGKLDTGSTVFDDPEGLAIDAAAGRIYWADTGNQIMVASLGGGEASQLDTSGAVVDEPVGLAIDPAAGRIYWANFGNGTIGFADLAGGGGGQLDIAGATPNAPLDPVLLKAPSAMPAAIPAEGVRAGGALSCSVAWAQDLPEASLYRAPQTIAYQWLLNDQPLAGATAQTVRADRVGRYSCQATATNFAGSTVATVTVGAVRAELKLGRVRLNHKTGTATLAVAAVGDGKLKLTGKGIKRRAGKARSEARLRIRATGRAKKRLGSTGRARVRATVAFLPDGGEPIRRSKTIVLRKSSGRGR